MMRRLLFDRQRSCYRFILLLVIGLGHIPVFSMDYPWTSECTTEWKNRPDGPHTSNGYRGVVAVIPIVQIYNPSVKRPVAYRAEYQVNCRGYTRIDLNLVNPPVASWLRYYKDNDRNARSNVEITFNITYGSGGPNGNGAEVGRLFNMETGTVTRFGHNGATDWGEFVASTSYRVTVDVPVRNRIIESSIFYDQPGIPPRFSFRPFTIRYDSQFINDWSVSLINRPNYCVFPSSYTINAPRTVDFGNLTTFVGDNYQRRRSFTIRTTMKDKLDDLCPKLATPYVSFEQPFGTTSSSVINLNNGFNLHLEDPAQGNRKIAFGEPFSLGEINLGETKSKSFNAVVSRNPGAQFTLGEFAQTIKYIVEYK